jgi:DNA-binding MarR family transcriptional regulator
MNMDKTLDPDALTELYSVMNEVQIVSQLWSNEMRHVMPEGLSVAQFSVLNWFSRVDDEATPGRLARAFQVTKGAMTHTLGRLLDAGLITISPDPSSGRRKIVRRTPRGAELREVAIANTFGIIEDFASEIDPGRLKRILPTLRLMRRHLDAKREESHAVG